MKVYVVLKSIFNRRDGWSIGSDRIEKIFDKREKAEEKYFNHKMMDFQGFYFKLMFSE